MKTYKVLRPFRIPGSPRKAEGETVRYGDKIGGLLVERGLIEAVPARRKKAKANASAEGEG